MPLVMAHLHDARVRSAVAVSEMEGPVTSAESVSVAGLGCKASWEKFWLPCPFTTGVSEEGEGHPCPAERGQREDSSEQLDGAQGPSPSTS